MTWSSIKHNLHGLKNLQRKIYDTDLDQKTFICDGPKLDFYSSWIRTI